MNRPPLRQLLASRHEPLILDGAMATMLMARCDDADCELLNITEPAAVREIHRSYLAAGTDIVTTNTFCASAAKPSSEIAERLRAACSIAADEASRFTALTPDRPRYVAASVGPGDMSASPEQLLDNYMANIREMMTAGVDLLLVESIYHSASLRCAAEAIRRITCDCGRQPEAAVSFTVRPDGRLLSGETVEEILPMIDGISPLAVGFNCCYGPGSIASWVARLFRATDLPLIISPNAGLPDSEGRYHLMPEDFARQVSAMLPGDRTVIAGGCCGTTPDHIACLARALRPLKLGSKKQKI